MTEKLEKRRRGRPKGSRNKKVLAREALQAAALDKINSSGMTPLEYMLAIMRDPDVSHALKLDAAAKAAPYVHPKLASIDSTHRGAGDDGVIEVRWKGE